MSATNPPGTARVPPRRWLLLATVMLGTIASVMSSTIVNVAVPEMSQQFGIGQERAHWVATAFMAAAVIAMLPTPWLLSRFGVRRVFLAALVGLMAGGLGGGFSPTYTAVLLMRAAEGAAAGVLQVIPAVVILRVFESGTQGRAMGIFGFGVVLAPALGPTIGGVLVDAFGWRSIFFIVLPFGAVAYAMAWRHLPFHAGDGPNRPAAAPDWAGLLAAAVGVIALLNGLVHLHDRSAMSAALLLIIAALALAVFARRQWRSPTPFVELRLLGRRSLGAGAFIAFVYGMALYGSTYLVPIFLQSALHESPTAAGAALMPAGLVLAAMITLGGRLADSVAPHRLVGIGLTMLAVSFVLIATVGGTSAIAQMIVWTMIGRAGLGLVMPSLSLAGLRELGRHEVSHGSSTMSVARQLGGAIGISIVGILLEWRLSSAAALGGAPDRAFAETFLAIGAVTLLAAAASLRMKPSGT
ncbi:MAG: DHA2 family efflux MFS transporter permease subunit [Burkholderiaceae bacterium]